MGMSGYGLWPNTTYGLDHKSKTRPHSRPHSFQNMTQTQLADALGIAQQTMAHYEGGKLRIPVALLSTMATLLAVSIEAIIGEPAKAAKGKRGPTPRLQRQMELISQLPRTKQKFVMEMLDAVIQQQAS